MPAETATHLGHRQRLKQRFLDGGADALPDYELLELLLFLAIPQRDVKPLAKQLLAHFGSFATLLQADISALTAIPGVKLGTACMLKLVAAAAQRLAKTELLDRPVIGSWEKLVDYCRVQLAHLPREHLHLLFLDRRNAVIAGETRAEGTIDHTPVYPREVARRALELNAAAVIMVHNRPIRCSFILYNQYITDILILLCPLCVTVIDIRASWLTSGYAQEHLVH